MQLYIKMAPESWLLIPLPFLLQSAVEPFIEVLEYPATKGMTAAVRSDGS